MTPDKLRKEPMHSILKYLSIKIDKANLEANLRDQSTGKNITKL